MPKVTSVEPQKKNPHRYNIFLDGTFAFGADEDTVVNFRLIVGKEIPKDAIEKVLFETEVGKLMDRIYNLFSRRDRSEQEVRIYLKELSFKRKIKDKDELSDIVIDALIERLYSKGLLDDRRFAQNWVESRRKSKKKGSNALKAELYQKGISKDIIDDVLSEEVDEESLAFEALQKKLKSWRNLEDLELKQKAVEFLVRRGFDYSLAKNVIEKIIKKEYTNS